MIDLKIALLLMAIHFVGDFVLQSDRMAKEKSTDWNQLAKHCWVYMIVLGLLTQTYYYAVFNAGIHFAVDAVTARINKRLWDAKQVHYFFVGVGFDQLIHVSTLLITWRVMYATVP